MKKNKQILFDNSTELVEIVERGGCDSPNEILCYTTKEIALNVIKNQKKFINLYLQNKDKKRSHFYKKQEIVINNFKPNLKKKYEELREKIIDFLNSKNYYDLDYTKEDNLKKKEIEKECKKLYGFKTGSNIDFYNKIQYYKDLHIELEKFDIDYKNGKYGKPRLKKLPFDENSKEYQIYMLNKYLSNHAYLFAQNISEIPIIPTIK